MQQHLGEEFVGIISATAEFGLFVTLKDLYVDGMVHVSQLGDDFFVFDQSSQSLVGQNRGQIFGLGDEVNIKVAGVNLEERKIDFELVQQLTHAGRQIRVRAPRVAEKKPLVRPEATEQVFGKHERESKAKDNADGEQPIRRKKDKGKPSSYSKKPAKKSAGKPETKDKGKVKKKAKVKKKKSNAKPKGE
jgi:ribonuclease R